MIGILLGVKTIKSKTPPAIPRAMINQQTIYLEIADAQSKIQQGLSSRENLPEDWGMLFVFKKTANYTFWMSQMKFDLDFVFLKNDQVVALREKVPHPQAEEPPITIQIPEKFNRVLELNSGTIAKLSVKVNDQIIYR